MNRASQAGLQSCRRRVSLRSGAISRRAFAPLNHALSSGQTARQSAAGSLSRQTNGSTPPIPTAGGFPSGRSSGRSFVSRTPGSRRDSSNESGRATWTGARSAMRPARTAQTPMRSFMAFRTRLAPLMTSQPQRHASGVTEAPKAARWGFSAVQLGPALKRFGDVLTKPVEGRLELPGDKIAQRALGYLHANCSHCHNQRRPARKGARCWDPRSSFDLSLYTGQLERVESTSAYRAVVEGADLVSRMEGHGLFRPRMPPLATEVRDDKALELIRLWSRSVPGLRKDH